MPKLIPPTECDSARANVSCRLDGELSELEARRLDDHLRDCAGCSAYARELRALADRLRTAPLKQPAIMVFAPARHRPLIRLQTAMAAAVVVALAAGSSFAVGGMIGIHGGSTATTVSTTVAADFLGVQADSNRQHILAMVPDLQPSFSLRAGRVIAV